MYTLIRRSAHGIYPSRPASPVLHHSPTPLSHFHEQGRSEEQVRDLMDLDVDESTHIITQEQGERGRDGR